MKQLYQENNVLFVDFQFYLKHQNYFQNVLNDSNQINIISNNKEIIIHFQQYFFKIFYIFFSNNTKKYTDPRKICQRKKNLSTECSFSE